MAEPSWALDLFVKSSVILALCGAGLLALRRSSASARHLLLVAAMASMLALPVMEFAFPRWQVPFLRVRHVESAYATTGSTDVTMPAEQTIPVWAFAWALGSGILAVQVGVGLIAIARARRLSHLPDGELRQEIESVIDRKRVTLLIGSTGQSPMTWGFFRPVLMLPPNAESWPRSQLRSVILHEYAHIERLDWMTQSVARLACALYWFHPGVWLVARAMEKESERAADDLVLNSGCPPEAYAEHLLQVARAVRQTRPGFGVAMSRRASLGDRLSAVLAVGRDRRPLGRRAKIGLLIAVIAIVAAIASAEPQAAVYVAPRPAPLASTGPDVAISAQPQIQDQPETTSDASIGGEQSRRYQPVNDDSNDDIADQSTQSQQNANSIDEAVPPSNFVERTNEFKADRSKVRRELSAAFNNAARQFSSAVGRLRERSRSRVTVDEINQETPEVNVDVPAVKVDTPGVHISIPQFHLKVPSIHVHIPKIHVDLPKSDDSQSDDDN